MPVGSATRASILTGRYGHRTGIGHAIRRVEDAIDASEFTVPRAIDAADLAHATSNFGTWGLSLDPL